MRRLLLAALVLAQPAGAQAESLTLHSGISVLGVGPSRPDPVARGRVEGAFGDVYGGLRAETVPRPDRAGEVYLFRGLRPKVGRTALDLNYTHHMDDPGSCCGDVALGLRRPLGDHASVGARVVVDSGTAATRTEAQAQVTALANTTFRGTLAARGLDGDPSLSMDLGATRPLGKRLRLRLRQLFASDAAERTELLLRADL